MNTGKNIHEVVAEAGDEKLWEMLAGENSQELSLEIRAHAKECADCRTRVGKATMAAFNRLSPERREQLQALAGYLAQDVIGNLPQA